MRVRYIGATQVEAVGLSAHHLRHYLATQAIRSDTALDRMQETGDWYSLALPGRDIESTEIDNKGARINLINTNHGWNRIMAEKKTETTAELIELYTREAVTVARIEHQNAMA